MYHAYVTLSFPKTNMNSNQHFHFLVLSQLVSLPEVIFIYSSVDDNIVHWQKSKIDILCVYYVYSMCLCTCQFHPKPSPRDTTRWGQKPSPGDNHCVQNPSTRNKTGSQKLPPPLGHKVRKFHKYIYKPWHYLKWEALWSQQIKRFFNEETDY